MISIYSSLVYLSTWFFIAFITDMACPLNLIEFKMDNNKKEQKLIEFDKG